MTVASTLPCGCRATFDAEAIHLWPCSEEHRDSLANAAARIFDDRDIEIEQ